jgi:membrane fusion protein, heavy metal efflux system
VEKLLKKEKSNLGGNDGKIVQVISGLKEGERVVTKGAYAIKLASASGAIPEHGHSH